ncbi:hypothetical protein FKM82_026028 [Ascaphus truei]
MATGCHLTPEPSRRDGAIREVSRQGGGTQGQNFAHPCITQCVLKPICTMDTLLKKFINIFFIRNISNFLILCI